MPTYFCNSSTCGAAIQYSVAKPEKCPKCGKLLKVPVVATVAKVIALPTPPPEKDDDAPLVAPTQTLKYIKIRKTAPVVILPKETDETDAGETTKEDDTYDRRAARRLARELLANLDPNSIHISGEDGEDDGPVRFDDLVRQAQQKES